jgi:hypothetical protein
LHCPRPLKGFERNQVWCEVVALGRGRLAWTQKLALGGGTSASRPKLLRLWLFAIADRLAPPAADSPSAGLGRANHRRCHPPRRPSHRADQPEQLNDHEGAVEARPPGRLPSILGADMGMPLLPDVGAARNDLLSAAVQLHYLAALVTGEKFPCMPN